MTCFVLCSVYNERANLERMWESVQVHIPGEVILVVVDGKFCDYPGEDDLSGDGTRDYAEREGVLITSTGYECDKRSAGLRLIDTLANQGDYVLVLDADETLTSVFGWPTRVGYISFTRKTRNPVTYGRCRLYAWEPGLEFRHRHYDLVDRDGNLVASLESAPDFQVVGTGDHYEKPRTPEKAKYYRVLREREGHPAEVNA